ncbi:MAG: hypothetical protein FJ218_10660 [Ignavibacteria bacterium]|nr:hypothetical protein [Ignavibacteria bacterium]
MKRITLIVLSLILSTYTFSQFKTANSFYSSSLSLSALRDAPLINGRKKTMKDHIHASLGFRFGMFATSVPQFDSIFKTSNVGIYGLTADFNVMNSLNIEIKYQTFSTKASKTIQEGTEPTIDKTTIKAAWEQNVVTIGPKYFFKPNGNVYPYASVGFGYYGAATEFQKTIDDAVTGKEEFPPKHKTYNTYFGLAFEGGIRYILPDDGLAFFVNGEISLATVQGFRFDDNATDTQARKLKDINIGGIGFSTGFVFIL